MVPWRPGWIAECSRTAQVPRTLDGNTLDGCVSAITVWWNTMYATDATNGRQSR